MKLKKIISYCIFIITLIVSSISASDEFIGMYGVPNPKSLSVTDNLTSWIDHSVKAVFVSYDKESVLFYKNKGFQVYISLNVFGGQESWGKYPDSIPVTSDGTFAKGGICPSHQQWRSDKINSITSIINDLQENIDGIWLDFIRYPGLWEVENPQVPNTCYCKRCLEKFQTEHKIILPILSSQEIASWIKNNLEFEWMAWKKTQIVSFVNDVKTAMRSASSKKILLGAFIVPWTKGERQNAISYQLAQDAFELSKIVDVISPMVYHKMCGRQPSWVGYMTEYYKETASCKVWPIIQSENCNPNEFKEALDSAAQGGADSVLIYSYAGMNPQLWNVMTPFQKRENLINSLGITNLPSKSQYFIKNAGEVSEQTTDLVGAENFLPLQTGKIEQSSKTVETLHETSLQAFGILAGNDFPGQWFTQLPSCVADSEYVFKGLLRRFSWENGVYPYISVWGQQYKIDTHFKTDGFQPVTVRIGCPKTIGDSTFRFINPHEGQTFFLTEPTLYKNVDFKREPALNQNNTPKHEIRFPIGAYGVNLSNIEQAKGIAINTVIIGGNKSDIIPLIEKCHEIGLNYVITVPREPDKLIEFLTQIEAVVKTDRLGFYVNDEPEIYSFPVNITEDIYTIIKEKYPDNPTYIAVVRPQACKDYKDSADYFLSDQYPIPYMPMTWLSDSIDTSKQDVGENRIGAVIQAFGGEEWAVNMGWPKTPSWQETDCLAFLSIIHGAKCLFFYSFETANQSELNRNNLGKVVGRLNSIYPFLIQPNIPDTVEIEMTSDNKYDPKGRPCVHACLKKSGDQIVILAVNSLGTYVDCKIKVAANLCVRLSELENIFSGKKYSITDQSVQLSFQPYESMVLKQIK